MNKAATASVSLSQADEASQFNPDDYLLGILRRAVAAGQNVAVSRPGMGEVRVLCRDGEYFTDMHGEMFKRFCSGAASDYVVKELHDQDVAELRRQERHGRNLDELIWSVTLHVSRGRLMRGCRRDDVVLLKRWPNLTRLPATPNAVRIAALLTRYPTSVALGYRLLKIPQEEMNDFYSAAHAAGWAVAVNRKPEISDESELKAHRSRGLLAQILDRIMGL